MSELRTNEPDPRALVTGLPRPSSDVQLSSPTNLLLTGGHPQPTSQTQPPIDASSNVTSFWLSKGVPLHVAQGIADQTIKESGGDPTVLGDSGTSLGLYQHHGKRMQDVIAAVENNQAFK